MLKVFHIVNATRDTAKIESLFGEALGFDSGFLRFDVRAVRDAATRNAQEKEILKHLRSVAKNHKIVVILHALGGKVSLGLKLLDFATVVPFYYGGEFGHIQDIGFKEKLLPQTYEISRKHKGFVKNLVSDLFYGIKSPAKFNLLPGYKALIDLLRSVDFMSGPSMFEIRHLAKVLKLSCEYIRFPLSSFEDNGFPRELPEPASAKQVQVGHSAFYTNNHLDCFDLCKDFTTRAVVPLSYGFPVYRAEVIAKGKAVLGDRFEYIEENIPFADYLDLLGKNQFYIAGQKTQFGLGNIYANFVCGSTVVMPEKAVLLEELRSRNFVLRDFKVGDQLSESWLLEPGEREHNLSLLYDLTCRSNQIEVIRGSFRSIESRV